MQEPGGAPGNPVFAYSWHSLATCPMRLGGILGRRWDREAFAVRFRTLRVKAVLVLALWLPISLLGCTRASAPGGPPEANGPSGIEKTVADFLEQWFLPRSVTPESFEVTIPTSWKVAPGAHPEGLYWSIVNEFCKDIRFDLEPLKGKTVQARRYHLGRYGRPGPGGGPTVDGDQYAFLLIDGEAIVGAWIGYVYGGDEARGLSLNHRYLSDITGLSLDEWAAREDLVAGRGGEGGPNADLAGLDPVETVEAFFTALSAGDKARAYACLSLGAVAQMLTFDDLSGSAAAPSLYRAGLTEVDSVVEWLRGGEVLSAELLDPGTVGLGLDGPGSLSRVEVRAKVSLDCRRRVFYNGCEVQLDHKETDFRYFLLDRTAEGWKIVLESCRDLDAHHPSGAEVPAFVSDYAAAHRLNVRGKPLCYDWEVPVSWDVPLGGYLEGVYWGLANVFSSDAGLDLTPLKGKTVTVWAWSRGIESEPDRTWDSLGHAMLLGAEGRVVGAWLEGFRSVVDGRKLEDITGLSQGQWLEKEGYFLDAGPNADLAALGPVEVLKAYAEAVSAGDQRRADACLEPEYRLSFFYELPGNCRLYPRDKALETPAMAARLLGWELKTFPDGATPPVVISEPGDRTVVVIQADLDIDWPPPNIFGVPKRAVRSVVARKTYLGWKIDGFGGFGL